MADDLRIQLLGVDDLKRALKDLTPKIRTKAVRSALRQAIKPVQTSARSAAPLLKRPTRYRRLGTIRKNIVIRNSKFARKQGDEGVYVSVRPIGKSKARVAKLGRAGARNPNDPFYWWWQELGWKPRKSKTGRQVPGKRFLTNAANSQGAGVIQTFVRLASAAIEKLNRKTP